jgi:hypothetical protein
MAGKDRMALKNRLASDPDFLRHYGMFHAVFSSLDAMVDLGIGKLLRLTPAETHLLTVGLDFGRRVQILIDIAEHNDHQNKTAMISALKKIQAESRRNAFAHSFISSSATTVTFNYRHREKSLDPKQYTYTGPEFQEALGVDIEEFDAFLAAAFKADSSVTTSPEPPSAKT